MKRDVAIAKLKAHEAALKQRGVDDLYVFGSTARDNAREDFEWHLFFDHSEGALGLFESMD